MYKFLFWLDFKALTKINNKIKDRNVKNKRRKTEWWVSNIWLYCLPFLSVQWKKKKRKTADVDDFFLILNTHIMCNLFSFCSLLKFEFASEFRNWVYLILYWTYSNCSRSDISAIGAKNNMSSTILTNILSPTTTLSTLLSKSILKIRHMLNFLWTFSIVLKLTLISISLFLSPICAFIWIFCVTFTWWKNLFLYF